MMSGMPAGLFYGNEIGVLLAALYEQILAIDEVIGCNHLVKGGELLLVERHASALYELTHFALAGKYLDIVAGKELYGRQP